MGLAFGLGGSVKKSAFYFIRKSRKIDIRFVFRGSFRAVSEKRFCAFCRHERICFVKKHASKADALACLILSICGFFLLTDNLDFRFIPVWMCLWGSLEFATQLRWRMSISCPHCGFDPVLYIREPKLAAEKVIEHLELRRKNPYRALLPDPLKHLPRRKKEKTAQQSKSSQIQQKAVSSKSTTTSLTA